TPGDQVATAAQHRLGYVDTGHRGAAAVSEHERHTGRAGGHIKNAGRGRVNREKALDHSPPPALVLAKRQDLGQQVVPGGQAVKQLGGERVNITGGRLAHLISLALGGVTTVCAAWMRSWSAPGRLGALPPSSWPAAGPASRWSTGERSRGQRRVVT